MASACVNNFLDCPTSYGWLSPRVSFSRDTNNNDHDSGSKSPDPAHKLDPEPADFEFRLENPVAMLPADELFSDGKLVPLHLSYLKPSLATSPENTTTISPDTAKTFRRPDTLGSDPCLFSPKAPRCSSRWKELLGLKKLYQSAANGTAASNKTTSSTSSSTNKSLRNFLHRSTSKTTSENASLSLPLLKDHSDCESVSISSSRLSLSSSSSSHEHDDLPRLSLDSEKPAPNPNPISIHRNPNPNHPRMRLVKARAGSFDNNNNNKPSSTDPYQCSNRVGRSPIRKSGTESGAVGCRGVSVDSPRMNSSGKIVFQSLERSSSSPSSFNGGPRFKQRGMERSYSANVRVTPVLNVPVCSLRGGSKSGSVFGFGQLFSSPQKKEGGVGNGGSSNKGYQHSGRNRCDRS